MLISEAANIYTLEIHLHIHVHVHACLEHPITYMTLSHV